MQTREPVPIAHLFARRRGFVPRAIEAVRPLRSMASGRLGGVDTESTERLVFRSQSLPEEAAGFARRRHWLRGPHFPGPTACFPAC